ncbi:MAG: hypothetical protein HUU32_20115 [Calditrichaceae bacterium]|nr:hypothetical protein [Calditrichia bacterium]NUQ43704.1 hypothetical protein [Calditrichaceae bacterium]
MIAKQELYELIDKLPGDKLTTARSFLEWLTLQKARDKKTGRIFLKGIIQGSPITEQDIEEAKKIWQLP